MRVPICWLKDYVDFDDTPERLAEKLTFAGLEVEAIERIGSPVEGVVAGKVVEVRPHPKADRLVLCSVEYGKDDPAPVVCGAPNVRTGGVYPFAPVGVTLPGGMKIKKAKLRGETSLGMLCAEDELGLSDRHEGLMELDGTCEPGAPMHEWMGPEEVVFELEITPNRPDCLSIMGLAREVAALYGTSLRRPETDCGEAGSAVDERAAVEVADPGGCPRYTARVLSGIGIGPSPDWMQKRLRLAGLRPINNVVDITNFVLFESGQPLHAFDLDRLEGGRVVVRRAAPGETLTTLDGVERTLDEDTLVIADGARPLALAGIMGGADSEIGGDTENVLLESAAFDPPTVRACTRRLGLHTDSSYRFQRGVDIEGVEWASRRAAALLSSIAGGTPARGAIDVRARDTESRTVRCRPEAITRLTGIEAGPDEVRSALESLELVVRPADDDPAVFEVDVPSFRLDLHREVDLAEEFARIHGLDRIPEATPRASIVEDADHGRVRALDRCRHALTGLGAREIMNYTLVSKELLDRFAEPEDLREVLPHPISSDQSILRTSLIPQMVETLGRNMARQEHEAVFFETGKVFRCTGGELAECERIALGMMGPVGRALLDRQRTVEPEEMFLWMKGLIGELLRHQNLEGTRFDRVDAPAFEPGGALVLSASGREIGRMGLLRAKLAREYRFNGPAAVAELDLEPFLNEAFRVRRVRTPAVYPAVERDFAFVVDCAVTHAQIEDEIRNEAPDELERCELFDIFKGRGIGEDKKSMAYRFVYRSGDRTLRDEEVNRWHDSIGEAVCGALDAQIREA
ncbi:phenylalanine--tRNA ligase subunit beta [Kiritimatiella glycovorans]|uniref:Phenylalanine--tRNA ligase beta subunit n=1 Tax=Kiritimatiella glycovorans TaxID=1307763 RepID=A0A0G3EEL6_9BACT|nr:phenylalanine--tRNA ligase subunit beta [Kiritimatiella glycovorans]AKJ63802.1 Phenylalanine--tRNA ligase beta subunit [Kiritimatiella glycovorans]